MTGGDRGAMPNAATRSVSAGASRIVMAAVLALAGIAVSCRGTETGAVGRVTLEGRAIDPKFALSFEALRDAVEQGEDELAERVLAGIWARGPEGRSFELAEGFQRILDGRKALRTVALELFAEPAATGGEETARDYRLLLRATHGREDTLELRSLPPSLHRLVTQVAPTGVESRRLSSLVVDELAELVIPPDGVVIDLGVHRTPMLGSLAARDRWKLDLRSGDVLVEGRSLPAMALEVDVCEVAYLAPFLPPEPVEPAELVRYVQRERITMPPLMERAVRIAPERRLEALEEIARIAPKLDDQRLGGITPALRWLLRTNRVGADATAWRVVLANRDFAPDEERAPGASGLDLPGGTRP